MVSALNGLHKVIVDRQGVLLDAAVKADVSRFISSDYSADFTKTRPGDNRNLDLRREFMARADRAPSDWRADEGEGNLRGYLIGLGLAILLTAGSFGPHHADAAMNGARRS